MVEEEGVSGLFKGVKPAFIGTAISQMVYFYLYSNLRSSVVEFSRSGSKLQAAGYKANLGPLNALGVASVAGCLAVVLTNPIWVVASRLQTARKTEAGSKETAPADAGSNTADPEGMAKEIRAIYEEAGLRGFWKGVPPALLMVSNPALQYMAYEWLSALRSKHDKSAPTAMQACHSPFPPYTLARVHVGPPDDTASGPRVCALQNRVWSAFE
ncbi:hypothetical protein CYMTET_52715 [Cymbomonas tetramitiformis]|uniref:Uncharacterized protein n=1 Tax=Cymbomonas tetramitiformis TaxID=36881 RepID=A0AAE0ERC3_9CHLO|nr:hypothetical protein CYMTET_52715 [Cymbomonas tetramitiformis]